MSSLDSLKGPWRWIRRKFPRLSGLDGLWRAISPNAKSLLWMLAVWAAVGALAYAVSAIGWRDDLSRSLIGLSP